MASERSLFVIADDYGIGGDVARHPRAARRGSSPARLLMVNSPHAVPERAGLEPRRALADRAGIPCSRWMLRSPRTDVPKPAGRTAALLPCPFSSALADGRIDPPICHREGRRSNHRFLDLVGSQPPLVACHHHRKSSRCWPGAATGPQRRQRPLPMLRRVQETSRTLRKVPGVKRCFCRRLGR